LELRIQRKTQVRHNAQTLNAWHSSSCRAL
jgi:hypothetical protein